MTASSLPIPKKFSPWTINLIVSATVTTLLFFIDEGYYNFNWTKNLWNWLFCGVYVAFILLGQTIAGQYILKRYKSDSKSILASFIGIPLGLAILFTIGFSIKYIFSL